MIGKIKHSIPIKISLAILIIEAVLLTVMGVFYSSRFSEEIDRRVADKLALPGILMNQRALPYDSVEDLHALSEVVQETVLEAFVFKREGKVFFTADPTKEGRAYTDFLSEVEKGNLGADLSRSLLTFFTTQPGSHFLSSITPLRAEGKLLGGLYLRISTDDIEKEKRGVVLFFCVGAFLTILLTTLVEAIVVHRLCVPRIVTTLDAIKHYGNGDFSARIDSVGVRDEIGELMLQVNQLLETISDYTGKLHAINLAGEDFFRSANRQEILAIAVRTAEKNLPVKVAEVGGPACKYVFSLPVFADNAENCYPILQFIGLSNYDRLRPVDTSFVYALSGLMVSALNRIDAFERITQAEEKYRYLFTSALEGIFRTRADGSLLDVNPAFAAMAGFDSAEEMVNSVSDISKFYLDQQDRVELMQVLAREGKAQDYEVVFKRRDGSAFPAAVSARAVMNDNGEIQVMEGRITDISERSQREKEKQDQLATEAATKARLLMVEDLEQKNRQLQETLDELRNTQLQLIQSEKMAAIGMTAGGVAHDLNNILSGIISYPELLLLGLPAESELRRPLESILASGRRAAAVVADLLTLAQGSAKVRQNILLDSLVEEYLQSIEFKQMMRDYPNVTVSSVYEGGDMCIICSPVHIQKVIMNLVMNAVEALSSLGGSVTLRTRRTVGGPEGKLNGQDMVVLEVRDDGPGIPPESRGRIFEPFYTRKVMGKKGTGLGLTVVWNVIREHQGRIELDCDSPGTTFRIYLPAQKIAVNEKIEVELENDLRGKGSILIVDDEPLQRDIAGKMLTIFGYQVEAVASGEEAVAHLREKRVDLVVLDMLMPPGINGLQTYRQIVDLHPGQKALIVSGFSESSDVKQAMQLGVGGFVKKPYTMAQIAGAVKDELGKNQAPSGSTLPN